MYERNIVQEARQRSHQAKSNKKTIYVKNQAVQYPAEHRKRRGYYQLDKRTKQQTSGNQGVNTKKCVILTVYTRRSAAMKAINANIRQGLTHMAVAVSMIVLIVTRKAFSIFANYGTQRTRLSVQWM